MPPYTLQQCFVIMSFSPKLESLYKNGIKRVVCDVGFDCLRSDEAPSLQHITLQIQRLIRDASFVIADLTEEKPNCLYELGYAHGLGKRVILTARSGTGLAFDVSQFPCIFYESERDLRQQLREKIKGVVLRTRIRDRDRANDPWNGSFGGSALANGRLLTARVLRTYRDEEYDLCDIRVDVIPLPGKPLIRGQVRFFVHPSFQDKPYRKIAKGGFATIELEAVAGAFTVGAKADAGRTQLEIDLATLPGAPFSFYPTD